MKRLLTIILVAAAFFATAQTSVETLKLPTVAGTNTYTVTFDPAPILFSGYVGAGYKKMVKFTNANTGASTFNPNGLGAITLRKNDGTALSSGDITAGSVWWLVYDGTASQWRLSGGAGSGGSFTLTNGNGTTAGATSVDLGGPLTGHVAIDGTFNIEIGNVTPINNFGITSDGTNNLFSTGNTSIQSLAALTLASSSANITLSGSAITLDANGKVTINRNLLGTGQANLNIQPQAGDVNSPVEGDIWYNSTTDFYRVRADGLNRSIVTDTDTQTLTNKTMSGASNTFTNIPISTAISGLGTGVATALGVNVGSAGAFVVNGGALGTPSSGTLTNATGYLLNNIANPTGTTTLALSTNPLIFTSGVTTGTGATAGIQNVFNSLTTGNGLDISSSSVSSGAIVKITGTGTAAASNTQRGLWVDVSGANATATQTTYGSYVTNTKTGTTGTNIAGYFAASGGTTNHALDLTGNIRVNGTALRTQFILMPGTGGSSDDSGIILLGAVNNGTGSGNAHGFADNTAISRGGNMSYNSFDAKVTMNGNTHDHYAAFQSRPNLGFAGQVITHSYAFYHALSANGPVTNDYGLYVTETGGTASNVTNKYGVYLENFTGAANNYGIYSLTTGKSLLTGDLKVGTSGQGAIYAHSSGGGSAASIGFTTSVFPTTTFIAGMQFIGSTGELKLTGAGGSMLFQTFYTNGSERVRIESSGNTGIGVTVPTAVLHLKAGTATVNTAPLKFTSGTNTTVAVAGQIEYDGTNFYSTNSTAARRTIVAAAVGAATASANDLTLPKDGNVFHITGATQINAIVTSGWPAGSVITLIFDSTPTVKNNTAGGGGTAVLLLAGAADFVATANDVLRLVYDGTSFYEMSRSVN